MMISCLWTKVCSGLAERCRDVCVWVAENNSTSCMWYTKWYLRKRCVPEERAVKCKMEQNELLDLPEWEIAERAWNELIRVGFCHPKGMRPAEVANALEERRVLEIVVCRDGYGGGYVQVLLPTQSRGVHRICSGDHFDAFSREHYYWIVFAAPARIHAEMLEPIGANCWECVGDIPGLKATFYGD